MKKYGLLLVLIAYLSYAADDERPIIHALANSRSQAEHLRQSLFANLLSGATPEYFIKVKTDKGQFIVKVPARSTYGELKQKIEQEKGISVDDQVLWLHGQELPDDAYILTDNSESPQLEITSKLAYSPIGW